MSRFFDLVSKPVRDMGGYAPALPAKPSVVEQLRLIGLDSNENPFGPSPRAVEAMLAAQARDFSRHTRGTSVGHGGFDRTARASLPNITGTRIKRSDERAIVHC